MRTAHRQAARAKREYRDVPDDALRIANGQFLKEFAE